MTSRGPGFSIPAPHVKFGDNFSPFKISPPATQVLAGTFARVLSAGAHLRFASSDYSRSLVDVPLSHGLLAWNSLHPALRPLRSRLQSSRLGPVSVDTPVGSLSTGSNLPSFRAPGRGLLLGECRTTGDPLARGSSSGGGAGAPEDAGVRRAAGCGSACSCEQAGPAESQNGCGSRRQAWNALHEREEMAHPALLRDHRGRAVRGT